MAYLILRKTEYKWNPEKIFELLYNLKVKKNRTRPYEFSSVYYTTETYSVPPHSLCIIGQRRWTYLCRFEILIWLHKQMKCTASSKEKRIFIFCVVNVCVNIITFALFGHIEDVFFERRVLSWLLWNSIKDR